MSLETNESKIILDNDKGHTNLRWSPSDPSTQLVSLDLKELSTSVSAENIIQSLPSQILYHAIKLASPEEVAAVLPLTSNDQMIRILDYDSWTGLELNPKKAFSLLNLLKAKDPLAMAQKYKQLDEEYQIALLQKYVELYDVDEFEKIPEEKKELAVAFPGNELFCIINTTDMELYGYIKSLIESAIALDINYAHALLAHAFYMPPNESEFQLSQFRKARLEEDGFVSYEESQEAFLIAPRLVEEIKNKWLNKFQKDAQTNEVISSVQSFRNQGSFLEASIKFGITNNTWSELDAVQAQQNFLFLANSLCTATQVEPDDIKGLSRILEQAKAISSLGLEYLSNGNPALALNILKEEYSKNIFRAGLYLIDLLRNFALHKLQSANLKNVGLLKKYKDQQKWGSALWVLDTSFLPILGLQSTEVLKGLFNRFPMKPDAENIDEVKQINFVPVKSLHDLNTFKLTLENMLNKLQTVN